MSAPTCTCGPCETPGLRRPRVDPLRGLLLVTFFMRATHSWPGDYPVLEIGTR
jgi:hypothetical protein